MIACVIGSGAINVLNSAGIEVIRGCDGVTVEALNQFISGLITDSAESCYQHEEHHAERHKCKHH